MSTLDTNNKSFSNNQFWNGVKAVSYSILMLFGSFVWQLLAQGNLNGALINTLGLFFGFILVGMVVQSGFALWRKVSKKEDKASESTPFWFSVIESGFVWFLFAILLNILNHYLN